MLPITRTILTDGFTALDTAKDQLAKSFCGQLPTLYKANKPGEKLHFRFKGTRCAIYDLIGPDCGQMIVTLDHNPPRVVPCFDAFCTYHRLAALLIGSELPDEIHEVTVEIHPEQPDKAQILAKNKNTIDRPERYNDTAFYPGAILLTGELVP
jgi:hypothetical protein